MTEWRRIIRRDLKAEARQIIGNQVQFFMAAQNLGGKEMP